MKYYELELKPKELFKLLFFKKICPFCMKKLIKNNEKTPLEKGWYSMSGTYYYGNKHQFKLRYYCKSCCKDIQLHELQHNRFFQ
ncbi:hypothetical protein [Cohnella sp. GCM10020058]|uniref:hypothetical protein n=1 Tax=Cohnella sp. GCM10020058 TaxID=3317330 RepID=UPI00366C11B1